MAIPLQYDIFARDRASGTFDKTASSMSRMNTQATRTSRTFSNAGAAIGRAARTATLATAALGAAGAALGLKTAASLQQAQISYETLLGSAKKAQAFLGQMTAFAARTPFQTTDVINYSRALLGAGQAAKDILPTLTAWGDTSGALGQTQEQFSRTMIAVTQIMNKGKLQAEELMQISESGIPIWGELSKALGMPIPAIQELMKEGKLLSGDVLPALQAQLEKDYGGAMGRQAKTLTGLWSTFKDTLSLGLAQAFQPLIPILSNAMPGAMAKMGAALQGVSAFIAAAIPKVSAFIGALRNSDTLQRFAGWITGSLVPALQQVGTDLLPKLQAAWASISGTIRDNHATFRALGRLITEVIIPVIGKVAGILIDVLGPAFEGIVWTIKFVVIPIFSALVAGILVAFDGIIGAAANMARWLHLPFADSLTKMAGEVHAFVADTNATLASIVSDTYTTVHITPVVDPLHNAGFIGPTMAEGKAAAGIAGPYTDQDRGVISDEQKKIGEARARKAAEAAANKTGVAIGSGLADGLSSTAGKVGDAGQKLADAASAKFDKIKQAAESLRDSVKSSVLGFFSLQTEGNPFAGLTAMANKAVRFAHALAKLSKQGVNPNVIAMIAQAGPDVGLRAAIMLSTAGKANRSRIDNAYERIDKAATRAGNIVTGAMYDDQLGVAKKSERHLKRIADAVTKGGKGSALANGWAAY